MVDRTTKQRCDGIAVEARASLAVRFHERSPDQQRVAEHQPGRRHRIEFIGRDLAGLDPGRGGIEPGGYRR
jgi:hypothetical protein